MIERRAILGLFSVVVMMVNLAVVPFVPMAEPAVAPPFGYEWTLAPVSLAERWVDISTTGTELFTQAGIDLNNANTIIEADQFLSNGFSLFDKHYDHLYVNINGVLILSDADMNNLAASNDPIPYDAPPNGLIAGFWTDLELYDALEQAKIYYQHFSGGNPPACAGAVECVVIQWTLARERGTEENHRNTFQIVLLDNNNIHFLYHTMDSPSAIATIGLEGNEGVYGEQAYYKQDVTLSSHELVFTYPEPAKRHKVRPVYQSEFVSRNSDQLERIFTVNVTNNGDDSTPQEIYQITVHPIHIPDGWAVEVPPNTGQIAQGASLAVQVKVTAPLGSVVGEYADVKVRFTSQDNLRAVETRLYAAYSAPFAQIVHNGDLYMDTMWDQHQLTRLIKLDFTGRQMSLAHMNGLTFFLAWERRGAITEWDGPIGYNYPYSNIEYSFVGATGSGYPNVMKNTEHYNTPTHPLDNSPAVSVGPDGRPAYAFIREDYYRCGITLCKKYNVRLTILDSSGMPAYPAEDMQNLTKNELIYTQAPNAPKFQNPRLAITADGHYVICWTKTIGLSNTVEMAIVNPDGSMAVPPFTVYNAQDITGDGQIDIRYYDPGIAVYNSTQILLAASRYNDLELNFRIVYKILDGTNGEVIVDEDYSRPWFGSAPDAVQLLNGQGLLAWNNQNMDISYVLLDADGNVEQGPVDLSTSMPDDRPQASVSVANDKYGNGILTWLDGYDNRLYYALVGSDGLLKTPPMILVQGDYTSPVRSSQLGYGNTFFEGKAFTYLPLLSR